MLDFIFFWGGGYSWLSILDQSSAYCQGLVEEGSRHLTASSMRWDLLSGFVSHLVLQRPLLLSGGPWREFLMV